MSSTIPHIDFGPFLNGTDRHQTVSEVDTALKTVGSFYLHGHGIDQSKIDACFEWSKRFFDLPEHEKQALSSASHSSGSRYCSLNEENVRGKACFKENFNFQDLEDDTQGPWPKEELLPGFRDFTADFYQDGVQLINKLLECLSMALGLGADEALSQYHISSSPTPSLLHYPAVSAQRLRAGEVTRIPAHSDTGTLTLLFQLDGSGLEVADMSSTEKTATAAVEASGEFLPADPCRGAIIFLVGHMLMRWTNGRWKNTVHRVVEPPRSGSNSTAGEADELEETIPDRYSIAIFNSPDADTVVEPLPICCDEWNPKKWKPVNAGEFLSRKRVETYS